MNDTLEVLYQAIEALNEVKRGLEDRYISHAEWWHNVGSGIIPEASEDFEEFSKRVTHEAWVACCNTELFKGTNEALDKLTIRGEE